MTKKETDHRYYHEKGYRELLSKRRKDNLSYYRERERLWRSKNPERSKGKLLQKYWPGTTWKEALDKFYELVSLQDGLCAICNKPETAIYMKIPSIGKIRDLCVDHCHETGKVRGLLCDYCNTLIARSRDNPEICISAANYLKKALK